MNTNEAPEKIYVRSEAIFKALQKRRKDSDIEYTRTDAFIEKATEFLQNNIDPQLVIYNEQTWKSRDMFIEDFKQYMKGK